MKPFIPVKLPLESIDWAGLVPLIGQAHAALARYDGILQGITNPALLLSPLTTQEAVLSSRIEGTQANIEEVLEYEANPKEKKSPEILNDIKEIINYRQAMVEAVNKLKNRPICLNLIKDLHAVLLDSVRGRDKGRGQFRKTQNYIGSPGCSIEEATFIPPSPDLLPTALDNWEKYLHFDERDKLVQLAVAKAQFEIIHPFLDGNGRIGRMLIPIFLFSKDLLSSPMFYLSVYFESHRDIYYLRLRNISQKSDWGSWITFFLTAIVEQSAANTNKVRNILSLYDRMKSRIVEVTHSQFAIQTLDAIFARPICSGTDFANASGIPTKQTAASIIRQLKNAEILKTWQPARGRRSAIYIFSELINQVEGHDVV